MASLMEELLGVLEKEETEYLTLIEELNKTKLQIPDAAKISELLNTRFQVLKELAKTYYEFENSPALTKKVKGILSEKILDKTIMIALPALCRIFTATNKRHYQ